MLRSLVARISASREYSLFFVESGGGHKCFVKTWDNHSLMSVCVRIEAASQRVPEAKLAGLSLVTDSSFSCQMPLSCQGCSSTLLWDLSDNRVDGRKFIVYREFNVDVFLHCYQHAHQDVFGGLETTSMIDYLTLRLRGAVQLSWCVGVPCFRRGVVVGRVEFADLRGEVADFILCGHQSRILSGILALVIARLEMAW